MNRPQWIRELDGVPASAVEKLSAVNIHRCDEFAAAQIENEDCGQFMAESGLTHRELVELCAALWAQYIGMPLAAEALEAGRKSADELDGGA